jgi:hypothetical protein
MQHCQSIVQTACGKKRQINKKNKKKHKIPLKINRDIYIYTVSGAWEPENGDAKLCKKNWNLRV